MAYCRNCGAYIPDGISACLACGYNESAQAAAAAQKAKAEEAQRSRARQTPYEDVRQAMNRHRLQQQERNRQWAEQEKARLDQQEQNRSWAEEEYARRQAQQEAGQANPFQEQKSSPGGDAVRGIREEFKKVASGNTALAALSYLSFFFALPFFLAPEDDFAIFHAKQGLRLFIFGAIADLITGLIPFGWILTLFRVYCVFKGISGAINGRKDPLPYIGTIGQNK